MKKSPMTLLLAVAVLLWTVGSAQALSNVRFLHASPDSPVLDAYVGGVGAAFNLAFKKASPYVGVNVTTPPVVQMTLGSTSTPFLAPLTPALVDQASYTVVVANERATAALAVVQDDLTPPPAGSCRLRLGHFAAGAKTPVDVYVTAPDANLDAATPSAASLAYGQTGSYLQLPAGQMRIRITPAGNRATVLYDSETIAMADGWVVTSYILNFGQTLDQTLTLVNLTNNQTRPSFELPASRARVRLANASPLNAIDLYLDGLFNINGLAPNRGEDYFYVASGTRTWQLNAFNTWTVLQPATAVDFVKNGSVTAVVLGQAGTTFETLFYPDDLTPPAAENFRIRFAHTAMNYQHPVDVYITTPGANIDTVQPVITNLAYKGASAYQELQANIYQIRATVAGSKQVIFDTGTASGIGQGVILTTIIAQDASAQAPLALLNFTSLESAPYYIIRSLPLTLPTDPTPVGGFNLLNISPAINKAIQDRNNR